MSDAGTPQIFDRALAAARLRRAMRQGPVDVLLRHAATDLADRLDTVKRSFSTIVDVGTPGAAFGKLAAARMPGAVVTALDPDTLLDPATQSLPFAEADLVLSGLALHTVNDLPGALAQMRRLLRPDGLMIACLPGGRTLQELRAALTEAEGETLGGASPRVAPFADVRDLGGLLQRAGFALPVTDSEPLTLRYDHLFALMADLRAMGATNALRDRLRRPTPRRLFLRAAEIYARDQADGDGRVRATVELVWLSGWAPHENQPKPLRPGSARTRLADALGVEEKSLADRPAGSRRQP